MTYEEDFDDARDDHFDEDEASEDDDETFDTVSCPYCSKQIHEDAVQCPHCENYISRIDSPRLMRRPWWIIAGLLLCLAIVYFWMTRGW